MKLQILSDIHIDSYGRRGLEVGEIPITDADLVLVAGDTSNSDLGMQWLSEQAKRQDKPIVTITGNHEYFGEDVLSFDENKARQWDNYQQQTQRGMRFLQCQSLDFATPSDEVRILGCTLWTDYQYQANDTTLALSKQFMRDYQSIKVGNPSNNQEHHQMFSPELSMEIHAKHREWLKQALLDAHTDGKKVVVMTHHSISPLSIAEKYADFASNAAFVVDLSDWMDKEWSPALWVHGHTHEAFDYQLGNTRVVVNPRAYPGEVSSTGLAFAWDKVVEI